MGAVSIHRTRPATHDALPVSPRYSRYMIWLALIPLLHNLLLFLLFSRVRLARAAGRLPALEHTQTTRSAIEVRLFFVLRHTSCQRPADTYHTCCVRTQERSLRARWISVEGRDYAMECISIAVVERWDGLAVRRGEDGCAMFAGDVWEVLGECWLLYLSVLLAVEART